MILLNYSIFASFSSHMWPFSKWSMMPKKSIEVRFRLFPLAQSSILARRSDVWSEAERGLNSQTAAGTNSPLKIFRSFIKNALSLINNRRPCDSFIPNSIHATSCRYFRWYGYTHVSLEKFTGWVCYLDMIDTSKTCLFKRSLAE